MILPSDLKNLKMNKPFILLFFSLTVFSFFTAILIGQSQIKYFLKQKFSFLNEFPFELHRVKNNLFTLILTSVLIIGGIAFFGFNYVVFFTNYLFTTILLLLVAGFLALSLIGLFFLLQGQINYHVLNSSIFMVLVLVYQALIIYNYFVTPFQDFAGFLLPLVAILGSIQLVIILNPRLKNWAVLEKSGEEENLNFTRPKIFILPFSEWLSIANLFLTMIVVLISLMI